MISCKGSFIITIDTEPDNQWTGTEYRKTDNSRFIPRFQELCEKYGFKPVYLTEYNMLKDPFFVEYAEAKSRSGLCEIGVHPHAWSTPPFVPLTGNDAKCKPFLIDYPVETMRLKFGSLMEALDRAFSRDIVSHRAGRWAFDQRYLSILKENGIKIDCSVLPKHSIAPSSDALPAGGCDFSRCSDDVWEMGDNDFSKPGSSGIYEVPMTVFDRHPILRRASALASRKLSNRKFGLVKLRPEQGNLPTLLDIVARSERDKRNYIEFMLHSSEFMPGASLAFPDNESIERLFADMDALFEQVSRTWTGATLSEYIEGRFNRA